MPISLSIGVELRIAPPSNSSKVTSKDIEINVALTIIPESDHESKFWMKNIVNNTKDIKNSDFSIRFSSSFLLIWDISKIAKPEAIGKGLISKIVKLLLSNMATIIIGSNKETDNICLSPPILLLFL